MVVFWEDTSPDGAHAKCEYDGNNREYLVSVFKNGKALTEKFRAGWEPRFGMDIQDRQESLIIAEKLAQKLEE